MSITRAWSPAWSQAIRSVSAALARAVLIWDTSLASCARNSRSGQKKCDSAPDATSTTLRSVAAIAAPMARPARRKSSVSPVYAALLIEIHRRLSPRPREVHRLTVAYWIGNNGSSIGVIHVHWPSAWAAMARASSGSPRQF